MQAIMETIFDIAYLTAVLSMGAIMCVRAKQNSEFRLFGIMALVLACGDAFHLVPRAYSLLTYSMDANVAVLGFGKLVTSITMTVFYVMLYHFMRRRYQTTGQTPLMVTVYVLAALRTLLCLFPQNDWFSANAPPELGDIQKHPVRYFGRHVDLLVFH